jgi:lipooligosaccharide transport system permease protein
MTKTPAAASPLALFAAPRISPRCWPVVRRNLLVWKKLALPSLLGNIAEPLIILVAFGYGLGALVGRVNDLPYILFLASGSICMSTMYAASFEAMYSAFSRMQIQKTWESILNAPIALDDIVFAEMLWAGIKSLITATAIAGVLVALGISRTPTLLAALPVLFLVGLTFAAIALVFNALAKGYDFFTYYFTLVLTPMTFLSGVYFPSEQMPAWLQQVAAALPLSAAVELVRPLVIGAWPARWLQPLAVLCGYAAIGYWIALALTRRRFFR